MPVRKIFSDKDNNELEVSVNNDGKLFVSVAKKDEDESIYGGWIVLDRSDLDEFIDLLMELKDGVFNDSDFEDKTADAKTA
jgi:hypothetical protein